MRSFIAIDPSLRNTGIVYGKYDGSDVYPQGWELIKTKKTNKTSAGVDTFNRCLSIVNAIKNIVGELGSTPDELTVIGETPSGSQNSSSAKSYGVSMMILAHMCLYTSSDILTVTPTELKKYTVGTNTATKEEIVSYVQNRYPNFDIPTHKDGKPIMSICEHVCDALCSFEAHRKKVDKY